MKAPGLVVVPAWNEEASLPALLREVLAELPGWDVLVIDDGSTDGTSRVAAQFPVDVLTLPINMGVGGALRAGFKFAVRRGYQVVVQVDADGQHPPSAVPALVREIMDHDADLVIGARFAGAGEYRTGGVRRVTMALLALLISPLARARLTDPTSGFKACGPRAVEMFAQGFPQEYLGDTVEALVIAGKAGLVVRQVPVTMRQRTAGSPSHSPVKSALMLVRAVMAMLAAVSQKAVRVR